MSPKFNTPATRPAVHSPVRGENQPTGTTHEGGPGWARDARSELFLLAVTNMVSEATFYEDAASRDNRYTYLVQRLACEDAEWTAGFLGWLRTGANMRSASLVGAAEYVRGRLAAAGSRPSGQHETEVPGSKAWEGDHLSYSVLSNRKVIDSVLQRADEPGELLAYWTSKYGRAIPKPIKRGIGDAVLRLGTEFNYLKWDSESRGFSFADILNLTHPGDRKGSAQAGRFQGPWQHDLFGYVVAKPYRDGLEAPESLNMLTRRQALMALPVDERRQILEDPELLRRAGITWEALAGWLQGPMDAHAWSAVIPSMGYMALLRNLRNFDQAGVPDDVAAAVAAKLADPEQVAKSHQFPMRFLSAYRAAPSLRWSYPLEQALAHSLANIPALAGRTLVLVDTSSSMNAGFSKDGTLMRWDAAATFAVALAQRCATAEVVSFSSAQNYVNDPPGAKTMAFPLRGGESLLKSLERWKGGGYFLGGGTDTAGAVQKHFTGHDRVVIVTDEQSATGVDRVLSHDVPLYTWNLAGYERGHGPSGTGRWHTFGGLTDAAFRMVPLLEAGRDAVWPWVQ